MLTRLDMCFRGRDCTKQPNRWHMPEDGRYESLDGECKRPEGWGQDDYDEDPDIIDWQN
jgi:hypothetical protein